MNIITIFGVICWFVSAIFACLNAHAQAEDKHYVEAAFWLCSGCVFLIFGILGLVLYK